MKLVMENPMLPELNERIRKPSTVPEDMTPVDVSGQTPILLTVNVPVVTVCTTYQVLLILNST